MNEGRIWEDQEVSRIRVPGVKFPKAQCRNCVLKRACQQSTSIDDLLQQTSAAEKVSHGTALE